MSEEIRNKKWLKVYTIFDDIEGQRLEIILKGNNIPIDIFYYQAHSVYRLYQPSVGKGEIRVREDYLKEAKRIIADYEKEENG